ncbi:hypothetical protein [Novosphingobium sp. M1R2S20]|uniref:ElaB/YqjD/DUF883 family membrane-anchored ribosome-binding protein n=1 Tax=Novosphingobium rhizovicinum TaxID=3228928 RepID=A0ABV3R7R1_9SPHN
MVETVANPGATASGTDAAKNHFAKAMEEALAGARALGEEAQSRAGEYREKLYQKKDGLSGEAKVRSDEYKDKAFGFANDGKSKACTALSSLGQLITENAGALDEKVGVKYGDYARNAAQSVQDTAKRLDEKSLDELGDDAIEFVRTSPALALGMAAAAGYLIGRVLK